jgi:hypothetical protein
VGSGLMWCRVQVLGLGLIVDVVVEGQFGV